jgi:hypothetical protein
VEHRWFGRLQRGRQGGHSLAKHRYRPARNLAHEWHHVSILCHFRNGRYIVEHQKSLTDSAINRHCFDRLRIVFLATQPIDPSDNDTFWHTNEYYPATSIASWFTRIGKFNFVGLRATLDTETLSDSAAALDSVELHALVRELARTLLAASSMLLDALPRLRRVLSCLAETSNGDYETL